MRINVTAPFRVKKPPILVTPSSILKQVEAIMVPLILLLAPIVAELPMQKKTLQALAPLVRRIC